MKLFSLFLFAFAFTWSSHAQISENVELLYQWSNTDLPLNYRDSRYSDVWGFTSKGREYGVIGSTYGTHFFDVTDPLNSYTVDSVAGAVQGFNVNHRDFHDYNGYLYGVADQGEATLQIIDLQFLPDSVSLVYNSNELVKRAHNVFIDSTSALMFICGPSSGNGMEVYSLQNPTNPILVYTFKDFYIHDVYVKNNIAFMNGGNGNGFIIMDFTFPENPEFIGDLTSYPDQGYNHSGWLSSNDSIYVFTDENYGLDIKICDVSQPGNIEVISTVNSNVSDQSIAHNVMIKDHLLYVSYYNDGLQIFDISNPSTPFRAGYYDTFDSPQTDDFRGAWGVYAFLPSGNILISDRNTGFHVLKPSQTILSQHNIQKEYNIYPNPVINQIHLPFNMDYGRIHLFDSYGLPVPFSAQANVIEIDNALPKGVYVITIENENSEFSSYKFIKE